MIALKISGYIVVRKYLNRIRTPLPIVLMKSNFGMECKKQYTRSMPRQRMLFIILVATALLAACSFINQTPTPAPTTISTSTSPYDGSWLGNGAAQDGRPITIKFTVIHGTISSFSYSYPRPDNNTIPCTGIAYTV